MVSQYQCSGKEFPQFAEQSQHGCFLFQRAGVHRDAFQGEAALIANADGMGIVVLAMCAHFFQSPSTVNFTVTGDVEMVADVAESAMPDMIVPACLEIQAPPLGGGGAMDND